MAPLMTAWLLLAEAATLAQEAEAVPKHVACTVHTYY
jgi:hypothetical protein